MSQAYVPVSASAFEMTRALELLPSIGEVSVDMNLLTNSTQEWIITFLNDLGDLPLLTVTRGRLNGTNAGLRVVETQAGTPMSLVYDGACGCVRWRACCVGVLCVFGSGEGNAIGSHACNWPCNVVARVVRASPPPPSR